MILGFKDRFVPAVADGTKPHTIRAGERWKLGMKIHFYQKVRQAGMAKIREDGEARVVQRVCLFDKGQHNPHVPNRQPWLFIDGRLLTPLESQILACNDGFDDFAGLLQFFRDNHGLPFTGQLIGWTDLRY